MQASEAEYFRNVPVGAAAAAAAAADGKTKVSVLHLDIDRTMQETFASLVATF